MNNLSINDASVDTLLTAFKGEMAKLDDLVDKIYTETSKVKIKWQGSGSDYVLANIDDLKVVFNNIRSQNSKFVKFIDSSIARFKAEDKREKEAVESNINAYDTSLYGNNRIDEKY